MPHPDAERWNARYLSDQESWAARNPRPLLVENSSLLPNSGLALDAAAGMGANSLFLARHNLRVISLDISQVALTWLLKRARAERLPVSAAVYDLAHPWLPPDSFEVMVNFHFLERATFPVFRKALKPGGLIFFETFIAANPSIPDSQYYLAPGELVDAFQDYEVLLYQEVEQARGRSRSLWQSAQLIARKPG